MLTSNLAGFASASLSTFQQVQLFDRIDTKFMISMDKLPFFIDTLKHDYTVLSIANKNIHAYQSVYFDTPDMLYYWQHYRDKRSRFKVRKRLYNLTDTSFLEVKEKTNHGRTIKNRTAITTDISGIASEEKDKLASTFNVPDTNLSRALTVNYNRISMADFSTGQRLTIDTDLHFISDKNTHVVQKWAVIEVKQSKLDRCSTALQTLKKMGVRPSGMSKYCWGTALLKSNDVPVARFQPFLKRFSFN